MLHQPSSAKLMWRNLDKAVISVKAFYLQLGTAILFTCVFSVRFQI